MSKISVFCLLAALPTCALSDAQNAEETILCRGVDESTIVLELWMPSAQDTPMHCLRASFATDMKACAAQGGWGLGSNDDMAQLVRVTNDWSTAHNHEMGKVAASAGKRGVRFYGYVGKGISSNLNYAWKFAWEISSGKAAWFAGDGQKTEYQCEVMG